MGDFSGECVSSPGKREGILPATGWEMSYCLPVKHGSLLLLSKCLPGDSEDYNHL